MVKLLKFKTVKLCNSSGFNLVEILLVVFIISILSLLFISPFISQNDKSKTNSILYKQLMAMRDLERTEFDKELWFNEKGNINRAQTKKIGNKTCVFNLGFGRFSCE